MHQQPLLANLAQTALVLPEPKKQEQHDKEHGREPPNPMHPARLRTAGTKFFLHELVVVKRLVGEAEVVGIGGLRPAGRFIRAAAGTSLGLARHRGTAVGTNLRIH